MNEQLITLLLWIIIIAVLVGQYALGRLGAPAWTTLIIPILWLAAAVFFVVNGYMDSMRDYFIAAMGLFLLFSIEENGRQKRKKKKSL